MADQPGKDLVLTFYKGDERQKENCICHHIYTHNSFNLERLHWIDLFGNGTAYRRCNLPPFSLKISED